MSKTQWGNAVWFLFHTLAEKLRPEYTRDVPIILQYFRGVATNLPCPTCSEHSMRNLRSMNNVRVRSKPELMKFFFDFHNKVNQQLGRRRFSEQECRIKYRYANTKNIILNFKRFLTIHRGNPKLMIGTQTQIQNVNAVLAYLQYNLYKFYE